MACTNICMVCDTHSKAASKTKRFNGHGMDGLSSVFLLRFVLLFLFCSCVCVRKPNQFLFFGSETWHRKINRYRSPETSKCFTKLIIHLVRQCAAHGICTMGHLLNALDTLWKTCFMCVFFFGWNRIYATEKCVIEFRRPIHIHTEIVFGLMRIFVNKIYFWEFTRRIHITDTCVGVASWIVRVWNDLMKAKALVSRTYPI